MKCDLSAKKVCMMLSLFLAACLLILFILKSKESFVSSNTEMTTKEELENAIPADGVAFVKFYAPWCGYCKKLAPSWDDLISSHDNGVTKTGKTIRILAVNCDDHKVLGKEYGIEGFPTIKIISGNNVIDYDGGREYDEMVTFVEKL